MRLKSGVTASQAADALGDVLVQLGNQRGGGWPEPARRYVRWVGDAEYRLHPIFDEPDVVEGLQSVRYGRLVDLAGAPSGVDISILYQEINFQFERLSSIKQQLDRLLSLASRPGDLIVIYDTNSLMHYQPPNRIIWSDIAPDVPLVRIVVPLCVISELDNKQHTGSDAMVRRARAASRALRVITDGVAPGCPQPLRNPDTHALLGATLEVLLEERGHRRLPQVDDEIIEQARLLEGISAKPIRVITADLNMGLRAEAAGIKVLELPKTYAKDRSSGT